MHLPPRIPFFGFERDAAPCVRFLGDITVFVTHWFPGVLGAKGRTGPCRGSSCDGCNSDFEIRWSGYAAAQQHCGPIWKTIVYDVAQGWLADFQPGLRGREYTVRRHGQHNRTHEYRGSTTSSVAAFDVEQWARRYWRIREGEKLTAIPFEECLDTLDTVQLSEPADEAIIPYRPRSFHRDPSPEERQKVRQLSEKYAKRIGAKGGA
jgi:hypothetical protein